MSNARALLTLSVAPLVLAAVGCASAPGDPQRAPRPVALKTIHVRSGRCGHTPAPPRAAAMRAVEASPAATDTAAD